MPILGLGNALFSMDYWTSLFLQCTCFLGVYDMAAKETYQAVLTSLKLDLNFSEVRIAADY